MPDTASPRHTSAVPGKSRWSPAPAATPSNALERFADALTESLAQPTDDAISALVLRGGPERGQLTAVERRHESRRHDVAGPTRPISSSDALRALARRDLTRRGYTRAFARGSAMS